jgi:hypothetical protein
VRRAQGLSLGHGARVSSGETRLLGLPKFVERFVADQRQRAEFLARHGCVEAAATTHAVASDLEAEFRAWWLAELTVAEAAMESGYSEERLREMIRERRLPASRNTARGHLSVRRCELPHRPGCQPVSAQLESIAARLLSTR